MVDISQNTCPFGDHLRLSQMRTELTKSFNMELERVLRELELLGLDGHGTKLDVVNLGKEFGKVLDAYAETQRTAQPPADKPVSKE